MRVMLITHFNLGEVLIRSVEEILGNLPSIPLLLNIDNKTPPDSLKLQAIALLEPVPQDCPILLLTDLFGSTPHNIAQSLDTGHTIKVISGINLPMLLRVFNYYDLPFEEVVSKAIEGAHNGIVTHKNKRKKQLVT